MSYLKTKENDKSVEEFLNAIKDATQKSDCFELVKLLEEISGHKAKIWGTKLVGFGSFVYKTKAGKEGEWFLIGFTPNKDRISVHLMHGLENETVLLSKLGKHKIGKGCLYIKRLQDVDINILKELMNKTFVSMKVDTAT